MPAVATLDDMADQTNEILLSGTPAQRKAEPHGGRFRPDVTLCPVSGSSLSEELARRYLDGATARTLAAAHGVSLTTVKAALRDRRAHKRAANLRRTVALPT